MRHTFASKVAFLFRELPDFTEDVETEWDLVKSAVVTSVAASCGCKYVCGRSKDCSSNSGVTLGEYNVRRLLFADDLALLSSNKSHLQ